ncbi:sulfotransferase family protein [Flavisphingomonas formosensis]|uniref:sulfotransferase family protein n=1 Tax=Flavisphingomonas formosensis TaxID=861534 RepID=UPI0012F7CDA5|nr:sulfotransferase [Sphingomonas formosensis]
MAMNPDMLAAAACEQTGLDDFGSDSFREGLTILCDSLSAEAQLNPFGQMALPGAIVSGLSNRLRIVDWAKRHPEVSEERIEAPIVVVGLFRAGTTFLSYLLEKDERHRPLLRWEAEASVPPPTPETLLSDPRIEAVRAASAMVDQINPRIRIVQSEEADGPTECIGLLNQDFKSVLWEAMANVPAYGEWLFATDHRSAYDYHERVLQTLQSGGVRGRWSLKSPSHALHLDALTAVYPDARLVVMHRDPVVLCASVCSLITTLTSTFSDADHRRYIADHWTEMLARSIAAIDAFRDANPNHRIVDVRYADLANDPIATMGRVYASFGDELDGQALAAMQDHVESHPKGRFGKHGYDPEEFGLDAGAIAERFRPYVERYDIPLETMREP